MRLIQYGPDTLSRDLLVQGSGNIKGLLRDLASLLTQPAGIG